jgi:hypothetical protein
MAWSDLDWPDLSPRFPMPVPYTPAPPRPDVPTDIAERVRHAERLRGRVVPACVFAGMLIFAIGLARYATPGHATPEALALVLLLVGFLVATVLPALAVLLVIGPTWRQRQQHLRLLLWQRERTAWLAHERERYLATLSDSQRAMLQQALAASYRPAGDR